VDPDAAAALRRGSRLPRIAVTMGSEHLPMVFFWGGTDTSEGRHGQIYEAVEAMWQTFLP
jgi:hypothetical protein